MANIRKGLLQFIFSGAYMKRWNDKLRPMELLEVDKQAHKMIVAWLLCQLNMPAGASMAERVALEHEIVEGGIFDYFFRLVITDIKPPVFYRIRENPEHYKQLAAWVLKELEPHVKPVDEAFWGRLTAHAQRLGQGGLATDILEAAHQFASYWEFNLLIPLNKFDDELPEIEESFQSRIRAHSSLAGVSDLLGEKGDSVILKLANLCGQLRFQKRWSQTPRIPETSVMGHMFIVACYAYFCSLAVGACTARGVNNFFAGLLHDLPEVLTRDIISPVKKSVGGLDGLIKDYEEEELRRRILDPLKDRGFTSVAERLEYFLGLSVGSEFKACVRENSVAREVTFAELQTIYNDDRFDPKDGNLLKLCDNLAAFLEAYTAVRNGIASDQLQQAIWRLRHDNRHAELGPLHVGALFNDFD